MTIHIDRDAVLAEAAEWFYDVHELWEDEDLDPDDHLAVVQRAFTSSDCDDFAGVVHRMSGWQCVRAAWTVRGGFGHHTLVRSPDGRLFDATGFTDEAALRKRYGAKALTLFDVQPGDEIAYGNADDTARIANVVRVLPHAPFDDPAFMALASGPLPEEMAVDPPTP